MAAKPSRPVGRPAKATVPATPEKVAETPAAIDWDAVAKEAAPAKLVEYKRVVAVKDVEATTPALVKTSVAQAFEASARSERPVYFTKVLPSAEIAAEFLTLMRRYCVFKEFTLRGGKIVEQQLELSKLVDLGQVPEGTKLGTVVVYSVKVKETRTRKAVKP